MFEIDCGGRYRTLTIKPLNCTFLNGQIVWCVEHTSIKLFFFKKKPDRVTGEATPAAPGGGVGADLLFPSCPLPTGHLSAHGYVPQRQDQPWLWGHPRGPHDATTWFPPLAPTQGPTPTLLRLWDNRSMDLGLGCCH